MCCGHLLDSVGGVELVASTGRYGVASFGLNPCGPTGGAFGHGRCWPAVACPANRAGTASSAAGVRHGACRLPDLRSVFPPRGDEGAGAYSGLHGRVAVGGWGVAPNPNAMFCDMHTNGARRSGPKGAKSGCATGPSPSSVLDSPSRLPLCPH